jgi:hypothetical protein
LLVDLRPQVSHEVPREFIIHAFLKINSHLGGDD